MQSNTNHQSAFTIIELLVTLAVLSIVTTLAVPAINSGISDEVAVKNTVQDLRSTISQARSQAIASSVSTTLCATATNVATTCESDHTWSDFWMVFRTDNNQVLARAEVSGDASIKLTSGTAVNFNSRGFTTTEDFEVSSANVTEKLCIKLWASGMVDAVSSC